MAQNVVLKRSLSEAGGFTDQSNGAPSSLYEVLRALAEDQSGGLDARQTNVATGILAARLISLKSGRQLTLRELHVKIDVCGSAGSTVIEARVNGVVKGTLTFANTDPDPSIKRVLINEDLKDGDVVDINVSTAPTGGTGLTASVHLRSVDVE